jgi:hypothetical protein
MTKRKRKKKPVKLLTLEYVWNCILALGMIALFGIAVYKNV